MSRETPASLLVGVRVDWGTPPNPRTGVSPINPADSYFRRLRVSLLPDSGVDLFGFSGGQAAFDARVEVSPLA